jgi:hypothetical protein
VSPWQWAPLAARIDTAGAPVEKSLRLGMTSVPPGGSSIVPCSAARSVDRGFLLDKLAAVLRSSLICAPSASRGRDGERILYLSNWFHVTK